MKHFSLNLLLCFGLATSFCSACNDTVSVVIPEIGNETTGIVQAQPLAGVDELGRVLPDNSKVGSPKKRRQVGMFYFLWQGDNNSPTSKTYWDLSQIVGQHPEVLEDGDNTWWGSTERGKYYFWAEPLYGYYRGDDYWVHLRNLQLLADAQIDFLVIDATNRFIYPEASKQLMSAIKALQDQGKNPPQIVYYTNTNSGQTMQLIYDTYYKPSAPVYFPSTWYKVNGKPLIIGRTKQAKGRDYESFFTFREAQWPNEPQQVNGWPWIDFHRPQQVYQNTGGTREIVNVSVSQHPNSNIGMGGSAFYGNKDNWGRSYANGKPGKSGDVIKGLNFQEQWDFALSQDVPYVFVTGWNEWIAGRWPSIDGNPEHSYFVDQASPEYSRDIEPTRTAGIRDNYYMQLIANVRRYKGVAPYEKPSEPKTISDLADWDNVQPVYEDYVGDTQARNHPSALSEPKKNYVNTTGQNDFVRMKVARDSKNLYFWVETKDAIQHTDADNSMVLYINSDRNYSTGWLGYDFRVIGGTKLQKYENKAWHNVMQLNRKLANNQMMVTLPLDVIQLKVDAVSIEFKWSDNMQDTEDALDWYLNGDAAPGGRLNFVYTVQ